MDGFLREIRAGDERSWARLFDQLAGPVAGYLRLRGAAEPEDLTSEVFLRVARGVHAFEGSEDQFRSWVFTIAHNLVLDERRTRSRRPVTDRREGPNDDADRGATRAAAPAADIEALSRLDQEQRVEALVHDLTPDQRDVVLLRIVADLPVQSVAEILGKEPNAIRQLQHRAVEALRRDAQRREAERRDAPRPDREASVDQESFGDP